MHSPSHGNSFILSFRHSIFTSKSPRNSVGPQDFLCYISSGLERMKRHLLLRALAVSLCAAILFHVNRKLSRGERSHTHAAMSPQLTPFLSLDTAATSYSAKVMPFNVLTSTATELGRLLDQRQVTAVDLAKAYMQQIHKHNKAGANLHAIISVVPEQQLLEAAARSDKERADGNVRSAYHGISFVVKVRPQLLRCVSVRIIFSQTYNHALCRIIYGRIPHSVCRRPAAHGL